MSHTLVVGSIALDTIEAPTGSVKDALGGSASYGVVAASYFAPVSLVGIVGSDFPKKHIRMFADRGINLDGLKVEHGETFRWHGWYERNMNNRHTNTTLLNVFERFDPMLNDAQRHAPYVFLANISPDLQLSVLKQVKSPKLTVMDTMDFWIEGRKKELIAVMKRTDVMLVSDQEARQFAETNNLIEAGKAMLRFGPKAVIIKKGEHGATIFTKDAIAMVPAYPVRKLKDPTGAGDVFAGAMTGYLARLGKLDNGSLLRAVYAGCVMASFVVEDFSMKGLLKATEAEVQRRAKNLHEMSALPKLPPKSLSLRNGAPAK